MLLAHPDNPLCTEAYVWSVVYRDGTTLHEYPAPTEHTSFNAVEIGDVVELRVFPNPWLMRTGPTYIIVIEPEHAMRPVMVRQVATNIMTGASAKWHVFGSQQTVNGKNVQNLLYVPDNADSDPPIIVTPRRMEIGG